MIITPNLYTTFIIAQDLIKRGFLERYQTELQFNIFF